ncbi:Proteasome activator complex subunit 2 [Triplophysa tibetana]|uniref:Proteasome activator complex subunit 2 n=1 Tax=Triplophysa tibetana TaxID=1572043 RepID=A0A5A9PTR1_9TELE|nr:Proteasome activator complex subunit 2 [Triplophysa tibetana]
MSKGSALKINTDNARRIENYRQSLYKQAEELFSNYIPLKISLLDSLLKGDELSISDLQSLHAPLDIPIPDPPAPEDEQMETDKNEDDEKKKKAPKCGFIKGNERVVKLLDIVKPEIVALKETCITVSCWISHLIPKIEDGNDFGVAIQEKILERITAVKTKLETFQTNINKYFSERGDAVAKASKETHVVRDTRPNYHIALCDTTMNPKQYKLTSFSFSKFMMMKAHMSDYSGSLGTEEYFPLQMDYRSLVHEKDEAVYSEIRVIVLDLRGFYAELYDVISKNLEKVVNPKGEEKPSMY